MDSCRAQNGCDRAQGDVYKLRDVVINVYVYKLREEDAPIPRLAHTAASRSNTSPRHLSSAVGFLAMCHHLPAMSVTAGLCDPPVRESVCVHAHVRACVRPQRSRLRLRCAARDATGGVLLARSSEFALVAVLRGQAPFQLRYKRRWPLMPRHRLFASHVLACPLP